MIDYAIGFPRKNGSLSRKVFKGSVRTLPAGESWPYRRRHPIRKVSTRKHYAGEHSLEVQVNGRVVAHARFELIGGD